MTSMGPFPVVSVLPDIRQKTRGILRIGSWAIPCALGRSGPVRRKKEGDGATPIAPMAALYGFYRADRLLGAATALPMIPLKPDMGWCDDVTDARYNQPITLPAQAGHERLFRDDGLYDVVVVLDWNISNRVRGRGSAIFLHMARKGYSPTEGCIAVAPTHMPMLLKRIGPGTVLDVRR